MKGYVYDQIVAAIAEGPSYNCPQHLMELFPKWVKQE